MTYSYKEDRPANKDGTIDAIGCDNTEMAHKEIHESVRSTTSRS